MPHDFFKTVSRETYQDFLTYRSLLEKWNRKVNLVSSNTLSNFMIRHVLDSAQLLKYVEIHSGRWLDIGSGGGFPGIPLAIISKNEYPHYKFTFMDSNSKKCFFLEEACKNLEIEADIICGRIEQVNPVKCDFIVSRALAPLNDLLAYSKIHRKDKGKSLFLKGKNVHNEISYAKGKWFFNFYLHQSLSDKEGKILEINDYFLKNGKLA